MTREKLAEPLCNRTNKLSKKNYSNWPALQIASSIVEYCLIKKDFINIFSSSGCPVAHAGKNFGAGSRQGVRPHRGSARTPEKFRKFAKHSRRKLQKMLYFRLFCKKFQNHALNLRACGRKTQLFWEISDENSMEKLNIYLVLGKFLAKNRNFGNNIIFLQQFFRFEGLGTPHPLRTPMRLSI